MAPPRDVRTPVLLVALAAVLTGCVSPIAPPAAEPTPTGADATDPTWAWSSLAATTPAIVAEVAVAQDDAGRIFFVGGWSEAGGGSSRVLVFDASRDTWSELPPYPIPIHHTHAAFVDGALHVFGGFLTTAFYPGTVIAGAGPEGWPRTSLAFRLDEAASEWVRIADLPEARGGGGAAVVDGRVLIMGGLGASTYTAAVDVYDPETGAWTNARDLPILRDHLNVVPLDGKVYAIAGRVRESGAWDDLEATAILDVANDTWSEGAPVPLGRGGQGAAVLDGRIILVGGERIEGTFTVYDDVNVYDPSRDAWVDGPRLPDPRHGAGVAAWQGRLFVAGGASESTIEDSMFVLAADRATDAGA